MDALLDHLKTLTSGYEIVTVGSSGGGYAATVAGMMLNAKVVYCFSGYFDLTLAAKNKWPILMEPQSIQEYGKWYKIEDIPEAHRNSCRVVYCFPNRSQEDVEQFQVVKDYPNFIIFGISNRIHGVSIGAYNLETFFLTDLEYLRSIASTNLSLANFTYLLNRKDSVFKAYKKEVSFYMRRVWNKILFRIQRR